MMMYMPLDPLFELGIETAITLPIPIPMVPQQPPPPPPSPPPVPLVPAVARYVDLSPYYDLPQAEVAKKFGMAASTLSRRWRLVSEGRVWPYRRICIIDKKLAQLGQSNPEKAAKLNRKRKVLLTPVVIDTELCDDSDGKEARAAHARRSKKRSRRDDMDEEDSEGGQ